METHSTPATLRVFPGEVAASVPDRLFGSFVEHLGRCVYGGIHEPGHPESDGSGVRRDVLALVRELGVTVVRYPGGNFVSAYRWEDGVGPLERRPHRLDPAWSVTESNRFGTDEFMVWCRKAGVEPMLAVNLGTRGVQEALDLLEYCNHPGGSAWADLRRTHGHVSPHNVRMWCLGNEMDGPWQTGHKSAEEYGRLAAVTARAMRQFDPTLELVLCGSSSSGLATFPEWDRVVLEHAYDTVDFISLHRYVAQGRAGVREFLYRGADMDAQIGAITAACDYVQAKVRSRKRMQLSFDEWNVWDYEITNPSGFDRWCEAPDQLAQIYTVADALVVASMLHSLLRHADRVRAACLAQLVNVIAPIRAEPGAAAWRQTIFHPFAAVAGAARGAQVVLQRVQSPCEDVLGGRHPVLDSVAVAAGDGRAVTVFALNRDAERALPLRVVGLDGSAWRCTSHRQLGDGDLQARNSAAAPDRVVLTVAPLPTCVAAGAWELVLPPASWHLLRWER